MYDEKLNFKGNFVYSNDMILIIFNVNWAWKKFAISWNIFSCMKINCYGLHNWWKELYDHLLYELQVYASINSYNKV